MGGFYKKLQELVRAPIRLAPERVYRLYTGGSVLDKLLGVDNPRDGHYPEAWYASVIEAANVYPDGEEGSRNPEGLSRVEVNGETILFRDLVRQFPQELIGPRAECGHNATVPLAAKLIDAAVPSVVQCHPDAAFARKHFNYPSGKNEAWTVLALREGIEPFPYVYLGFRPGMSIERFTSILERGDSNELHDCIHRIPVNVDDVFYIPAGTIHALGPGILALEVHEPADFTFRAEAVWLGRSLTPVQRHLGLGFATMAEAFSYEALSFDENVKKYRFRPITVASTSSKRVEILLAGPPRHPFGVARLTLRRRDRVDLGEDFSIGLVTRGQGYLHWPGGSILLKAADGVFFPAVLPRVEVEPFAELEMVLCYLKELPF